MEWRRIPNEADEAPFHGFGVTIGDSRGGAATDGFSAARASRRRSARRWSATSRANTSSATTRRDPEPGATCDHGSTYTIREKNGLTYVFENVAGTVGQTARLLRIMDRNGNALTLTYAETRLTAVTDDLGRSLAFVYDGAGRITEVSDWTGRRHRYGYDAAGNLVSYHNPLAEAGLQPPVTYAYYTTGVLTHAMQRYTLPRGNGMTFEYYADGRVFRHVNTFGETVTFRYVDYPPKERVHWNHCDADLLACHSSSVT